MTQLKFILLLIFISFTVTANSQSIEITQLKALFKKSSTDHLSEIYFNEDLKIIEINVYQFSLEDIELEYKNDSETVDGIKKVGCLVIKCKKINFGCITDNENKSAIITEVGIAFINKTDAYKALNLITKLKYMKR